MSEINQQAERQKVYDYVRAMLGDGMIDVELDPIHYETALTKSLSRFRQRSPNAVEESYMFVELSKDEPFNQAYTNTYLLNSSMLGGIATYDFFAQYQEMVGKMFGSYIEFQWIPHSHVWRMLQRPFTEQETVMLRCYNFRPDFNIINDLYAGQWIKDYTLAICKGILGEARGKFSTIAGPQGGSQLNGSDLKAASKEEIEKLDKELETLISGGTGYTFIIG